MKIFKSLLLVVFFIGLTGLVSAQNKPRTERRIEQLKEAMKLTDEQTTKITEIMTRQEKQAVQEQSSKPLNKRAAMKNERMRMSAIDKEIEPLLTPEQLKKYESYKKERTNQMRSRTKGSKFKEE
jgi:Spy/CpxP family protein refolding chaperone